MFCCCCLSFSVNVFAASETDLFGVEQRIAEFTASDESVREPAILTFYSKLFHFSYTTAPELQIARENRKQKAEELYTAKAKRYAPAVDAQLSQTHEFEVADSSGDESDESDDERDLTEGRLNLDFPIFRKSLSVAMEVAESEEKIAENELRIATQELDLRLKELLGNYLEATYRLYNIENSVKLASDHVARIQKGYDLRDQTKLQLLRAQANLNDLETQRDLDEQEKEVAYRAILDFTGLVGNNPILNELESLLGDEVRTAGCINSLAGLEENYRRIKPYMDQEGTSKLFHFFKENSLLYKRIVLEKTDSQNRAQRFTQDEWFDLSLRGHYGFQDDADLSETETDSAVSLVFSVPIFSGGTLFSNQGSKAAALQIADTKEVADVRTQFFALLNTRKFIEQLQKVRLKQQFNLRQQQEIVVLSLKSYQIKQTSMQDLLTSQNRLIAVKNGLMQTTNRLGTLLRQFGWQLGFPYPSPPLEEVLESQ